MFMSLKYLLLSPISLKDEDYPFTLFKILPNEGFPLIDSKFQAEIPCWSVKNKNLLIIFLLYELEKIKFIL